MASDAVASSSDAQLTGVVAPRADAWTAECAGAVVYRGPSPIDATHHARLELIRRGGGELIVLDSLGRHFKRFVVDPMYGPA